MPQKPPTASSSSNFQTMFYASMKTYKKNTKKDLLEHPLMTQLQTCNSPADIMVVLQNFKQSTSGDDKLTEWLTPTVNVLYAFSEVIGAGVGLVFPPANVIFAGAGVLLSTAMDVLASQDTLVYIFGRIEGFFKRLESYTDVPTMEAMKDIIGKIMVEVLGIFGIVTKELKQGRTKKYLKRLIGRRYLEDALSRLDRLTQEEAWMATAQVLKVAHRVEGGVETVGEQVKGVDVRVKEVDDKVDVAIKKVDMAIEDGKVVKVTTMETKALVQQSVNNLDEAQRSRVRMDHRAWLSSPDPSTNQNIACSAQHEGTATWFFQGTISNEWKSKLATSLLWIHGKPGAGKSVLCSAIIEDIMALRDAGLATMAYFYFDFRDTDKQNLHNALPSLLTQLSARSDGCCDILSRIYKAHDDGAHKPSTNTMITCLKEMLGLPGQGPIYIILDALDECPNDSGIPSARKRVLDLLKDLVGLQVSNLHICVTSRPEVDIRAVLEPLAFHSVSIHDQTGQKEDIEDYIKSVVYADSDTAMKRWRDQDKELVVETLTERADGMFRWVFCQLEVLQNCFPQNIRRTLNELPRSLDETYERVLKQIGMANRDHAYRLLQCLTVAIRPLRVEELSDILVLDFEKAGGATPTLNKDWRLEDRQRAVLSICSSLITVVDDGDSRVIQFSHFSVKEFLTSNRLATSEGDYSHFHIIPEPAHTTLAQACLGTLLQLDRSLSTSRAESSFPLAKYASQHWVEHAQFGTVSSWIEDGMRRLFDSDKPYFSAWLLLHNIDDNWCRFWGYGTDRGSPLYYASLCGFRDLAAHIIVEHPEQVNARGGRNYSPLAAALYKRHFDIAELLHRHGADVDVPGYSDQTPLFAASENGFIDVVQWLLDHGADVNSKPEGHNPFYFAVKRGHLEIVRMLLGHGARPNFANEIGLTPLHRASQLGYVEILRLLLQHGVEISAQDKEFSTPLYLGSSRGELEIAPALLDNVVDLDVRNTDGRTPLHLAASEGRVEIVRLLLDRGANANAEDKDGSTPLHLASSEGERETVRFLLNRGATADVKDKKGRTPHQVASGKWEREIVEMLADVHGAEVDARDSEL